jgi:hypothetical protein
MVQLKRNLSRPSKREPDNTYWAIGGTAFQTELSKGSSYLHYKPPVAWNQLAAYDDNKERGLIYYRGCSIEELDGFIQSRGIPVPKGSIRKAALIAILKQADEDPKFTKLFELPSELRNIIYGKYFEDLGVLPQLPHQPPMLLASSALRNEASPLYYQHSTFTLGFITNCRTPDILQRPSLRRSLRTAVHRDTQALLKRISDQDFASIKRLKLQVWRPELDVGNNIVSFATWTADLSGSMGSVITQESQDYRAAPWVPLFKSVGEALERALGEIRARSGAHKLSKRDVYGLMSVIHNAMM